MKENESADSILAEEQLIDGKKVDCKLAVPREQGTAANTENPAPYRTKKIFVGGLPPDVTQEMFINFFEQFGQIEDSVVMFDRETGRPRGFGFITFVSEESVDKVIENNENNYISGKWVECKKAMPKHNQQDERYGNYQSYTNQPYYNPQYSNQPYTNQYQNQMYSTQAYQQPYMMYPYYNMGYYEQAPAYDPYWQNQAYTQETSAVEQQHSEEQIKEKFVDDLLNDAEVNQQQNEDHRNKTFN